MFAAIGRHVSPRRRSSRCSTTSRHRGRFAGALDHDLAAAAARRRPAATSGACCRCTRRPRAPAGAPVRRAAQQQQRLRPRRAGAAGAVHVCYCHSPFRYAWYEQERALAEVPAVLGARCGACSRRCAAGTSRPAGASTATSPTRSSRASGSATTTAARRRSCIRRSRPPASPPASRATSCWWCRRSSPTSACTSRWRRPAGRARRSPWRARDPTTTRSPRPTPRPSFLGRVEDQELARLYASARAVLVPAMEEFGITAVEAQAAGRPVIAAARRRRTGDGARGPHRAARRARRRRGFRGRSNGSTRLGLRPPGGRGQRRALLGGRLSAGALAEQVEQALAGGASDAAATRAPDRLPAVPERRCTSPGWAPGRGPRKPAASPASPPSCCTAWPRAATASTASSRASPTSCPSAWTAWRTSRSRGAGATGAGAAGTRAPGSARSSAACSRGASPRCACAGRSRAATARTPTTSSTSSRTSRRCRCRRASGAGSRS